MSITNVEELQEMHLDVLKEIGNIGSGNAASSLSTMLNVPIDISVPSVQLLNFDDAVNFLGGPENVAIGMLVTLTGDISGMMLYVIQHSCASSMTQAVFGTEIEDMNNMNEMEVSFIIEIGNVMSASYINAIASLANMTIDISVPNMCVDMAGAILSVPAVTFAQVGNKVLLIDDSFIIGGNQVKSNMILVPEMDSLEYLFTKLGVNI